MSIIKGNYFDAFWILGTFALAYTIMALVIAPMLLPIDHSAGERNQLIDRFIRYLMGEHPSFVVVREGKVIVPAPKPKSKVKSKSKEEVVEEEPWVTGRSAIITDGSSVVITKTETGISQVMGPGSAEENKSTSGVLFTNYEEQIDSIIDLRPQMRSVLVKAQTRDGIIVEARITAFFTLKGTKARRMIDLSSQKPNPFTWRQASMRQAFHNKRLAQIDGKEVRIKWDDRVMEIAIPQLRQLISQYTLDYLTAPLLSDEHPRYEIRRLLDTAIREQLNANDDFNRGSGIEMRFIAVSIIWPPPPVVAQRIEAWKKEWHKKEIEVMGRAAAQALITKEQARANAQGELTARINDTLQTAKASGTNSSDLIALRFLEVVDKMAKDPTTRALLTLDSLKMLNQLRAMLKIDSQEEEA